MLNAPGAAIYVRADGPDNRRQQLFRCQAYANQHGLVVIPTHIYEEEEGSEQIFDRPIFATMFQALYGGKFSHLVVTGEDVLFHGPDDLNGFKRVLAQYSIQLHTAG